MERPESGTGNAGKKIGRFAKIKEARYGSSLSITRIDHDLPASGGGSPANLNVTFSQLNFTLPVFTP
ncbi:hypothetical protein SH668x_002458 [Planctomicrobium sp. SH668]|uniref:hypothetical protein n=1 Tax=Planctomicrobium sp. SH668 TaxID=3448126 RepID=UPI003F5BC0B0